MPEKERKEFTFMSEQLKKKPFYKKKWFIRGCQAVALAVIFGAVAGFTFAAVMPWAEKQFGEPDDPAQIVIVQDETESETQSETQTETPRETQTETETQTESETAPVKKEETIIQKKELDISDYKQLYWKMASVAEEAATSIVTVTGESSNEDWFNEVIENHVQASGLMIEKNRQELFILTEKRTIEGADRIIVTFSNGTTAEATLVKQDSASGMAVVKVPLVYLDDETKKTIHKANLGDSYVVKQGDPVIALGSPVGNSNSISFGMITSAVPISTVDQEYEVLTTDIIGSSQGSGILVNLDGKIIGIIAQTFRQGSDQITLSALALSDIRELIQALANNEEWTYMGITGKEITETISKDQDMPCGIYIKGVAADSPAMYAGIKVGIDILVSIGGEPVRTMEEYVEELQKHRPDEIVMVGLKRSTLDGYVDMEVAVTLGRG
ncbi:MAG: S1C family serine protease [Lachnospiraceae bacterium]|jgi:serine protease Do|nr:S1C family serine protease [Lachnospiraceae bacterium]